MPNKPKRLKKEELHQLFLGGLGDKVDWHSDLDDSPLLIDCKQPFPLKLRVYLFNCTNPPGGRAFDEYKAQIILPGQERGTRGFLDYSEGRMPIVAAHLYENHEDIFILWDADKHESFSYSANMQVKAKTITEALYMEVSSYTRKNNEQVLAARAQFLYKAIAQRAELRRENVLDGKA